MKTRLIIIIVCLVILNIMNGIIIYEKNELIEENKELQFEKAKDLRVEILTNDSIKNNNYKK